MEFKSYKKLLKKNNSENDCWLIIPFIVEILLIELKLLNLSLREAQCN